MAEQKAAEAGGLQPGHVAAAPAIDMRERLIVLSLEFSKRALAAKSLDDLYFLLTNDVRALVEFDRSFLVTHWKGESQFVAAGNQPLVEAKSKFYDRMNQFAASLKDLDKPALIADVAQLRTIPDETLSPALKEAIETHIEFSGCTALLCVPLSFRDEIVGHLILEYLDGKTPDQNKVITLLRLAPFFASALAQQWLFHQNPALAELTRVSSWRETTLGKAVLRHLPLVAAAAIALLYIIFWLPIHDTVGGEAEIVPRDRHVAFCQLEGLIDKIHVLEGSRVQKGQVLATLDETELRHRIRNLQLQVEQLTTEMHILKKSAGQDLAKLAESQLVELKRKGAQAELDYLKWQAQFLFIKAPASGVIVTKHVERLVGKKLKPGEPFCEIAVPGELYAEIAVPEDRIINVKQGQDATIHLNNEPLKGYPLTVKEIAPRADVLPRLGNIYRVLANFPETPPPVMVGMKGIGKIYADKSTLWSIFARRVSERWNQFSIHVW